MNGVDIGMPGLQLYARVSSVGPKLDIKIFSFEEIIN
jgi:hypothetical protein